MSWLFVRPPSRFEQATAFAAAALLLLQVIGVVRMLWANDRFFAWAPHDQRTTFTVDAMHHGRTVSPQEIQARYQLPPEDWHAYQNVLDVVRIAESRVPDSARWRVSVRYRVNFGDERRWCYPDSCVK